MDDKSIIFNFIGIIETPFTDLADMPIQPCPAVGVKGKIILYPGLERRLQDLEGFSHLIL